MRLYTDSAYYHCTLHQTNRSLPTLLMMHGFMGSGNVFEPLIEKLLTCCNPLTIDLAGHGKTDTPDDAAFYTAERQCKQLHSVLNRINLYPLFIYGYSMGGRLAFQLLTRYPETIAGAIIESAHCGIADKRERSIREALDEERAIEIKSDFRKFTKTWSALPMFKDTPAVMQNVYSNILSSQKPERMAASLRGFGAGVMPPVCERLQYINVPVQLIAGSLDDAYVRRMKHIEKLNPAFSLEVVPSCSHRVHACHPEKWVEILQRNLKAD